MQTCPTCGLTEAAGTYCTHCFAWTEPSWLHISREVATEPTEGSETAAEEPQQAQERP
jgi:hypothetical protein